MIFQNVQEGPHLTSKEVGFYLIIKEVMVEHIIVAELILTKKLAVPKRSKKKKKVDNCKMHAMR